MKKLPLGLWLTFAPLAAQVPTPPPTQVRTIAPAITAINVRMAPYNAVPFGNDFGPDQTIAIQSAINDACSVTTGTKPIQARPIVFIPAGRYALKSGGLRVPCSGLTVRGAGTAATELCFTLPAS